MIGAKVLVSGAGGFVGRNVGRLLEDNGFEVVALSRRKAGFGRTVRTRDLAERGLVGHARGAAALVHLVGSGRQTVGSDYEHANVQMTRNAVSLCRKAGVGRIIYLSGLGASRGTTLGYFISKYKAEREIAASGLDFTIFRPSYIMGRGDPLTLELSRQAARGRVEIPGSGRYRMQPVFVDDAARVVMLALTGGRFSRKILDLVGPRVVTYRRLVRDLVGRARVVHVDFERAYHDALASAAPSFGVDDLGLLVGDYLGDHERLARISGMKFTSYGRMLEACRLA